MIKLPKMEPTTGQVFVAVAFLAVFFFFFTRPAPTATSEGKETGPHEVMT